MASTSRGTNQSQMMVLREVGNPPNYHPYPPPLAEYTEVVANPQLFMSTLEKLHSTMGTKFMIPIIGGKELDLHHLFVEVTNRGGIQKILRERRWKAVTATFNFPSTATNASFVLRKYYVSLLQHYEQIYFFKARGWTPVSSSSGSMPSSPIPTIPFQKTEPVLPAQPVRAPPPITLQPRINAAELPRGTTLAQHVGTPVIGVIDGKFESGYLVTISLGSEKLKGVLYQTPSISSPSQSQRPLSFLQDQSPSATASGCVQRRRRRKKSEIKGRDPSRPKTNRSGYNFFFAEQHARLKPLHPGKDRETSRMIGELWTNLGESEKDVYQEIADKDRERYKLEMERYRERLRTNQVISNAVPLQQRNPEVDTEMDGAKDAEEGDSPHRPYESSSGKSEYEDFKDEASPTGQSGGGGESSNKNNAEDHVKGKKVEEGNEMCRMETENVPAGNDDSVETNEKTRVATSEGEHYDSTSCSGRINLEHLFR